MKGMDDLPTTQPMNPTPSSGGGSPVGSMAKESAPPTANAEAPLITEIGKEVDLPAEVKKAGVTLRSDTVTLPKPVQHMGLTPVGQSAPTQSQAATVALPLTDDQIAKGLHQSLLTSWRWLAEWCTRQLKQAHVLLTSVQGKIVRTKT